MIGCCETAEAFDRMRSRQAALLTAISRERADLYAGLGATFAKRMHQLAQPSPSAAKAGDGVRIADAVPAISTETVDA